MLRKVFILLIFPALILSFAGCGSDQNSVVQEQTPVSGQADWVVNVVNGQPIIDQKGNANPTSILFFSEFLTEIEGAKLAGYGQAIGSYYVRISAETGWIGGCINKVVPHVGIMISLQGSSTPMVNIHFAVWRVNGRVCGAIYNSGTRGGFCWSMCGPSYKDMQNALKSAMVAAGINTSIAIMMSIIIMPIVMMLSPVGL